MKIIIILILIFSGMSTLSAQQVVVEHSHLPIDLPENIITPRLSVILRKDTMEGYNLTLNTKHYSLIPPPEDASMAELMKASINKKLGIAEGHAHLYINGVKIQRVYGHYVHIPQSRFKNGINTVSVTLNNHGHMYWLAEHKKILSTLYVDTNKNPFVTYRFDSFPVADEQ